tara:strand:+ start:2026 stop:2658 length:633 start_codon:yes stop_codon:yes gene_type:complete
MYNSLFISDIHLGKDEGSEEELIKLLEEIKVNHVYLVGDIIDGWYLRLQNDWNKNHTKVVRKLLKLAEETEIIYLVGNHDDFMKSFLKNPFDVGNIKILQDVIHLGINNKKYLVTHGHRFDYIEWIPLWARLLWGKINPNAWKNTDDLYCSTEPLIKKFIIDKFDGVICGHTHKHKMEETYMNCGHWNKNRTYIVEHLDGTFELKTYPKI